MATEHELVGDFEVAQVAVERVRLPVNGLQVDLEPLLAGKLEAAKFAVDDERVAVRRLHVKKQPSVEIEALPADVAVVKAARSVRSCLPVVR